MCFNEESSISVFTFGTLSAAYLFYRGVKNNRGNDKFYAVLLVLVSFMQLIEFFLWKNQKKCNNENKTMSFLILVLLYLQVAGTFISYYIINGLTKQKRLLKDKWYFMLFGVFSLMTFYFLNDAYKNIDSLCSFKDNESCRLIWRPLEFIYNKTPAISGIMLILYLFLIGNHMPKTDKLFSKNYTSATLIFSIAYAIFYKGTHFVTIFGSLWCFLVAFMGAIYILDI